MKKFLLIAMSLFAFSLPAFSAVDLNNATESELEVVNGIGPKKAQAIVEYRKKNGPFKSVDDLDNVSGFGKKTVDKVRNDVSVAGAPSSKALKTDKAVKPVAAKADKAN